jgi:hypothetical protein
MPRGRRADPDRKIADLIAQLKAALVAREQSRVEAQVASQVDVLVRAIQRQPSTAIARPAMTSNGAAPRAQGKGNRAPRSAAFREAARKRMVAYWKAKKAEKAK